MARVVANFQSFLDDPDTGVPVMDITGTVWICPHCHRPVTIGDRQCFYCKLLLDWRNILGPRDDEY